MDGTKTKVSCHFFAVTFLLLGLTACFSGKKSVIVDPISVSKGERNSGKTRFDLLKNSVFSFSSSYQPTKTLIPINPICLNPLVSGRGNRLVTVDTNEMVLALFPADRRKWNRPIIFSKFDHLSAKSIINARGLEVDISSIPDGRYHMLLCVDEISCTLPSFLKRKSSTDRLGNTLISRQNQKYRFLDQLGIFASQGFSSFLQNTLVANKNLIGVGANIWFEQGLLVWPKTSVSVWNGRLTPTDIDKIQSSFRESNAVPPTLHILYGKGKKGLMPGFCFQEFDPLIIDYAGRGANFSNSQNGLRIDLNKDDEPELVSWPKTKGIAFLMVDENKNGKFDGISEVLTSKNFSNNSSRVKSGFDVLKEFDSNHDGVFDSSDSMYERTGAWKDENGNGIVDSGESLTLSAFGIELISLKIADISESDYYGNSTYFRSVATKKQGGNLAMIYAIKLQVFE